MALAAKRTVTIRLGVAVALLPYRNPIFTAEEYAMVDILSGGRLDFGVGRGTPPELAGLGVKEDNRDVLVEALEIVKMAWSQGKISFNGKHYHMNDVSLNVTPVQKPTPPIFFAALSEISFYKATLTRCGHDAEKFDVVQCFHAHVARTDAEAQQNARAGMVPYLSARLAVRPRNYDELLRDRMIVVGDPAHCAEHIAQIEQTGTNYIIFMMNFATLAQEKILRSMEIMAREVIPRFT
jgi:alkanesulfonate monooxygenase SsuD/methylene tetrahydromethanopterin reductase-like flavin-dependent oxidoreductase (luciferase family)